MITPFEHIELMNANAFNEHTSNLCVTINPTPKVILLRGLIGSIKLKHTITQREFEQTTDYFDLMKVNSHENPLDRLKKYIANELSTDDLGKIFKDKKFLHQNQSFFDRLNNEFSNYYYYDNKQSHTTAFAYLYRILETISYAFPLIYAAKTDDFKGTYNFLKDCISGNKDKGELGFFKSFIKVVFENDPLFESSITINIDAESEDIQQSFFNSFMKACPDPSTYDATDHEEPRKLSVKFSEYSSFIICLRNKFFHLFNSGQPNLQSDDILDADHFFKLVNKQTTYWISLVLLEILKHSIIKSDDRTS